MLAIVGIAVGATALVSCVSAAVGMSVLRYYKRKWADQRTRAFEAVRPCILYPCSLITPSL